MSLYNEVYNSVLSDAHEKYKKLHNLYMLKGIRQKINCYKTHAAKPDQYYDCFFEIEGAMLRQSQEFINNCEQIDVRCWWCRMNIRYAWQTVRRIIRETGRKNSNVSAVVGWSLKIPSNSCTTISMRRTQANSQNISQRKKDEENIAGGSFRMIIFIVWV